MVCHKHSLLQWYWINTQVAQPVNRSDSFGEVTNTISARKILVRIRKAYISYMLLSFVENCKL